MRFSAAFALAGLVAGSAAAGCPYAERANNDAAAAAAAPAGCPYAKRAAAASTQDSSRLARRGPIEGKKGIFYSKWLTS